MAEIRCLSDHQDQIRALINVNGPSVKHSENKTNKIFKKHADRQCSCSCLSPSDGLFASGSHAGELILWDALDWNILAYEHILWEEPQASTQAEIRLSAPKPSEMSIQHLTTDGKVRGWMRGWRRG